MPGFAANESPIPAPSFFLLPSCAMSRIAASCVGQWLPGYEEQRMDEHSVG
ncbi:MAG: hypothetical protein MIO93_06010 [ANME-2 cluster archaeon]|nr:hypothetical protein [ANME-2 cluster archaeon]